MLLLICLILPTPLFAAPDHTQAADDKASLYIGVLSFRNHSITDQQWGPLTRYLAEQVPGQRFELRSLHLDDMTLAVERGELDFVLTHPEHYVHLRALHRGLAPIATLAASVGQRAVSHMGGVIIRRNDRSDIATLADLRGKRIATALKNSIGGFRLQQWILLKDGINIQNEAAEIVLTGQPQDRVVDLVLQGKVDVGFIRTGLIESMVAEGKLAPDALHIVNLRQEPDFPLLLSTPLAPEWPFLANQRVAGPIIKAVARALLRIDPNNPAALAGQFHSFSPPADYSQIEVMMLELNAHPGWQIHFGLQEIIEVYPYQVALALSALLSLALTGVVFLGRSHRQIGTALHERASILDSLGEGVFGIDGKGRCTFINPKALEMLGWGHDWIIGRDMHALLHHHRPDGSDCPRECPIYQALHDHLRLQGEDYFFRHNGTAFPVAFMVTPVLSQLSRHSTVVAFRDISEERLADEAIRIAAIAFETQEGMVVTDADTHILRVNQAFTRVTGYTAEEAVGQTPSLLKSGRHGVAFYQEMWIALQRQGHWKGEIWNRRKNGEIYPEWLSISAVRDERGKVSHYVASFLDISQRKEAEERIQFLAYYDPLTRLPNRSLLNERLAKLLAAGSRHSRHGALLFIDLDNFKTLNDTMGHATGDSLLAQVASRLQQSVRVGDSVSRLGGDEFVVLLEDLSPDIHDAIAQVRQIAEQILTSLREPYQLGDITYHGSASIGAVPFCGAGESIETILKSADMAMYKAKEAGKNTMRFFDPVMQTEIEQRVQLERELRLALAEKQFVLYLQSQVDREGKLLGAEALIRWQHPQRGLILPGEFIPLAEDTRLILPIGQWVLHEACHQLASWQRHPATAGLTLAVNVSAVQFHDSAFVDNVTHALNESGAHPASLKLEITESLLLENVDKTITRMRALKELLGVDLSLDDFGTGYSSLSYLKQLPLDQVKLDRSFVRDIDSNANDAAIADAVIALGRAFNLTVIAEGVENARQCDALLALGCDAFQGYLYAHPINAEDFTRATMTTP